MSLIRNALGMQRVAEVLGAEIFAEDPAAKLADLSSKSCVSDQQILLVCRIRKPPVPRSSRVSYAHPGMIWEH